MILNYYYPNEESKKEGKATCNLFGHLKNEPTACVGVSGCYGLDDMHFTINSLHNSETNAYILKTTGELVMVEDELAVSELTSFLALLKSLIMSKKVLRKSL